MDERKPPGAAESESTAEPTPSAGRTMLEQAFARGSSDATPVAIERTEHSVMEGLPPAKAERIAAMRRELAELQRQLIEAQQRIATELHGRAEDAERLEAIEARLHEHETKAQEDAARAGELVSEVTNLRAQLSSVGATTEELRRVLATRDSQIEQARHDHRGTLTQLEEHTAKLAETKTQLEAHAADLASRTAERDSEQATKARLEQDLADERKKHGHAVGELETHAASLRDATALVATRDAELATLAKERDAVNAEIAASRAKLRELANQFLRVGNELIAHTGDGEPAGVSGSGPVPTVKSVDAAKPPPIPPRRTMAHSTAPPVEAILELSAEPRSKSGIVLAVFAGVILGCIATVAIMSLRGSDTSAAADRVGGVAPSQAPVEHGPATLPGPAKAASVAPADESQAPDKFNDLAGASTHKVSNPVDDVAGSDTTATATDGTIVLPHEAAEHRLFVDGHVVPVKNSRAVVRCGSHEIRIGSHGTPQTVDVACGIETDVAMDPHDH
jgi:hypothetical protein